MAMLKSVLSISDEAVIFDVGANVGEWSLRVLAEADASARLHLFEPFPATFERLRDAVRDPRAILNRLALSDSVGTRTGYEFVKFGRTNSLQQDPIRQGNDVTVSTTTVDTYMDEQGIRQVTYLKVDTEGHDLAVIRGAKKALSEGRIQVLQFEYNHRWVFARAFLLDVFQQIAGTGYVLAKITPKAAEAYPAWHPELERFFEGNYVLVRSDLIDALPINRGHFDASNTYRTRQ